MVELGYEKEEKEEENTVVFDRDTAAGCNRLPGFFDLYG